MLDWQHFVFHIFGHLTAVPTKAVVKYGNKVELECSKVAKIPVLLEFSVAGSFVYHTGVTTQSLQGKMQLTVP